MDFIEACRQLIKIDSTPGQGNYRAAECVGELCRAKGLAFELQEATTGGLRQANVIIRPQKERPRREVLFQTHLDTPDPGPFGLWTKTGYNPFDAHIMDKQIYGLGSADTKLDFICKLEALASLPNKNFRLPPVLVATYGEESGMMGALKLIRKNMISTEMAMVGEPTGLRLVTAGKGFAAVEIQVPFEPDEKQCRIEHNLSEATSSQSRMFHGKAAHSSAPQHGESAIKKMFEYLLQMPEGLVVMEVDGGVNFNTVPAQAFIEVDPASGLKLSMAKKLGIIYRAILELETAFEGHRDMRFNPPQSTLNIGVIRTYDDHIGLSGNSRMPPSISTEVYESFMSRLQNVCQSVGATLRIQDYKKPYQTEENSEFVKGAQGEMRSLGLSPELHTQASTNEASLFSRVGIQCISFGPGIGEGNIHTPTEHVGIEDLKTSIEFYKRIMERFCV